MEGNEAPTGYWNVSISSYTAKPATHAIKAVTLNPLEYQYDPRVR